LPSAHAGHQRSTLIDVNEAASQLGVGPRFARRLVSERRINYFKVGKYIRFDPREVDAWLSSCKVEANQHLDPNDEGQSS